MSATFRLQRLVALLCTVLATTVALLAATAIVAPDADAAKKNKIRHAMRVAKHQIGDPYNYGSDGPNAFDCSGLTYYAFQERSGIRLPRSTDAQYRSMRPIAKHRMHKGDMMFFHSGGGIYHVGIFIGWKDHKRRLLHAPSTGHSVNRDPVWTRQWKAATLRPAG